MGERVKKRFLKWGKELTMKKRIKAFQRVLQSITFSNVCLDHYWFLPKPVALPLHQRIEKDVIEKNLFRREEAHNEELPKFVTNYRTRTQHK